MPDEATGQGGAPAEVAAATPAATPTPTPEAAAQATPAAPQDATTAEVTADAPVDEFGDLFTGEEPAPDADPAAVGADVQQYLSMNPNVNTPELLAGAVADAGLMWDVIKGTQPASALFDTLRQSNPTAWQNVMQGVAGYLENLTGMKLIDPASAAAATPQTPEQQRIAQLEQKLQREEQQRNEFALTQKVNAAQKQMVGFVTEALKGSFMEGNETYALQMAGMKLAGKEQEIVDALQRGDTSMIDRALKQVRHEERIRFNQYGKRLAEQRKTLAKSLPKADGSGAPPDARAGNAKPDLTTREGRLKYMSEQFASAN